MSEVKNLKVLVVDDEKLIRDFFIRLLKLEGVNARTAEDGLAAIEAAKKETFDLVFLDIRMPRLNGIQTFSQLKKINPNINCVFITGYAVEASLIEQLKEPRAILLKKPFDDIGEITVVVNKTLQGIKDKVGVIDPKEKTFQERRAYLRVDAVLEIDYKVKGAQEDYKHCTTKNVSPCGMLLYLKEDLSVGTILELRIKCSECAKICELEARVAWNNGAKDKNACCNAGIEFSKVDMPEFSELLMHCVIGRGK